MKIPAGADRPLSDDAIWTAHVLQELQAVEHAELDRRCHHDAVLKKRRDSWQHAADLYGAYFEVDPEAEVFQGLGPMRRQQILEQARSRERWHNVRYFSTWTGAVAALLLIGLWLTADPTGSDAAPPGLVEQQDPPVTSGPSEELVTPPVFALESPPEPLALDQDLWPRSWEHEPPVWQRDFVAAGIPDQVQPVVAHVPDLDAGPASEQGAKTYPDDEDDSDAPLREGEPPRVLVSVVPAPLQVQDTFIDGIAHSWVPLKTMLPHAAGSEAIGLAAKAFGRLPLVETAPDVVDRVVISCQTGLCPWNQNKLLAQMVIECGDKVPMHTQGDLIVFFNPLQVRRWRRIDVLGETVHLPVGSRQTIVYELEPVKNNALPVVSMTQRPLYVTRWQAPFASDSLLYYRLRSPGRASVDGASWQGGLVKADWKTTGKGSAWHWHAALSGHQLLRLDDDRLRRYGLPALRDLANRGH